MARNPVTFSNGTLVQKAQVEVDGTTYEVEPAQFSGTTPLSASNLNLLQTRLYDYVDNEISNLNTVQTFTETLTDSNSGIVISTLWKRVGKVITLNVNVEIPANKAGLITVNKFPFTFPEWVKPIDSSNYLPFWDGYNRKVLGEIRINGYGSNNASSSEYYMVTLHLICDSTNNLILWGAVGNNDTSNERFVNGTITYILD